MTRRDVSKKRLTRDALVRPLRVRILEALTTPHSAASLARLLDVDRQTIGYHLRQLARGGLLDLVEEQRKGNRIERTFRAGVRATLVSAGVLGSLVERAVGASPSNGEGDGARLVGLAARSMREVSVLSERAGEAAKRLPLSALEQELAFPSASARDAFVAELTAAIAALSSKYATAPSDTSDGARTYRVVTLVHPAARLGAAEPAAQPDDPPEQGRPKP